MDRLTANQREMVETESNRDLEAFRMLKSAAWGDPSGIVSLLHPPHPRRSTSAASSLKANIWDTGYTTLPTHGWLSPPRMEDEVQRVGGPRFSSQRPIHACIIVDPRTLKTNAIMD